MTGTTTTERNVSARDSGTESYGLRKGVLGPIETLAQSVSAMAPSTSASLTIPLVFAYAGSATWFVYLLATGSMFLVGFCISRFARLSASPGSLYTYTANTLPPPFGVAAAWGLLLAYVATGASVAGGALYYATVLSGQFFHRAPPAIPTLMVVCVVAGLIAYRDVQALRRSHAVDRSCLNRPHRDRARPAARARWPSTRCEPISAQGRFHSARLGPHLVLSIFSFVGFEGATTLGGEVRDPLRTIPRAVLQCALLAGGFFMLCAYSEVLGFRGQSAALSSSTSPLHMLAAKAHVSPLGVAIDCGAFISMFSCVLACATAAARVLLRMAHDGLLPAALGRTNQRHGTPGAAVALSIALMLTATAAMAVRGETGSTMYDFLGSLSVFGFLTAYALVALALPFARRALGQHSHVLAVVSVLTVGVILMIAIFDLNSAEDIVHARIPYLYLGYIAVGLAWYALRRRKAQVV